MARKVPIIVTVGRWTVGKGSGEHLFKYRKSAMREHFSVVLGITNKEQLGPSSEGAKNPSWSKDATIWDVARFSVVGGKDDDTARIFWRRSAGTNVFQTDGGIGKDPRGPRPLAAITGSGLRLVNRKG